MWNSACDVDQIPYFDTSGSPVGGTFNVNVVFNPGPNPNNGESGTGCGWINMGFSGGSVSSATITLYGQETNTTPCDNMDVSMAHEIGHLMGLQHTLETAYQGRVMYSSANEFPSSNITGNNCFKANSQWFTS